MPSNWLYIDTNFPTFTDEEDTEEKVTTIQNYMFMLVEQLRYTLHNLDLSNMNRVAVEQYGTSLTEPIYARIEDGEANVAELALTAAGLALRMNDAEGNITSLAATAEGLSIQISDAEDDILQLGLTAQSLSVRLGDAEGNISSVTQYAESITLAVTNGETSSLISLKAGSTVIASQTISMYGMVTFAGLSGGTTTIDGACIKTGTISAARLDLTGAITFSDLSSDVQSDINDAWSMAYDAQSLAQSAEAAVGRWTYTGSTYIDGSMIMTGTVMASNLLGGTVGLLASGQQLVGGIDIAYTSTGYGVELYTNWGGIRITSSGNIWMESNGGVESLGMADGYISCGADTMPRYDGSLSLGRSGYRWAQVYAAASEIVTSDREEKNTINYEDLARYDALFDALKPCSYRYNNGRSGRTHTGLIAQDVEEAMEGLGLEGTDFAGFIKEQDAGGETPRYALRYEEFIALCIRQIQALKQRVSQLEGG